MTSRRATLLFVIIWLSGFVTALGVVLAIVRGLSATA